MKVSDRLAQLAKQVDQVVKDGELDFLIDEVPKIIMRRTRLGKGVSEGGELDSLKPLSAEYIKFRKKHASELSQLTSVKKSNLTASGQLLSSIQGNRQGSKFVFTFKDARTKTVFGGSSLTNGKVAEYVRKGGRRFFDLSKSERAGLQRRAGAILKRAVRNLVKNS
jgi:hypothetical protein